MDSHCDAVLFQSSEIMYLIDLGVALNEGALELEKPGLWQHIGEMYSF